MNSSPVNLRNLERIQEGAGGRGSRLGTLLLAASGTAAVLVVAALLRDRTGPPRTAAVDQLAVLVAEAEAKKGPGAELKASELGFPELLSDAEGRTTALVAVKDKNGQLIAPEPAVAAPTEPPPALDQLPVVPLPAGTLLSSTTVTTEPKDGLMQIAVHASDVSAAGTMAEPGNEGGYSVQVASFKEQDDAERFVTELRRRGHRAFRLAANVPGRGVWHRVRIGSFQNKYEATLYKKKLEDSERLTALVIDPEKVERQEQVRAAKLAERIRKYGTE